MAMHNVTLTLRNGILTVHISRPRAVVGATELPGPRQATKELD